MGSMNQMNRSIPNHAQLCFRFGPLLKIGTNWFWNAEHDKALEQIHECIKHETEVTQFKRIDVFQKTCDATRAGSGAVLQQLKKSYDWKPIHFASRFLTSLKINILLMNWSLWWLCGRPNISRITRKAQNFQGILDQKESFEYCTEKEQGK